MVRKEVHCRLWVVGEVVWSPVSLLDGEVSKDGVVCWIKTAVDERYGKTGGVSEGKERL
jgi:hypothetical protein